MTYSNVSLSSTSSTRTWRHGEFPMPDWVSRHMAGETEANGTFALETDLGRARVHLGNVVIERNGRIWVRPIEEFCEFMHGLDMAIETEITNVGPGKVRLFGASKRLFGEEKDQTGKGVSRRFRQFPVAGSPPSIEWIKLDLLSVDSSYQRSTDNDTSKRLIASIAAKFDWRLCAPLVVSRRSDDSLTIIDGQHRWMAACKRDDVPHLPCCIFRYKNMQEEARMFILANRARKPMSRLDDYFAALAAADEDAIEIHQIVEDAGLSIARNTSSTAWKPGEVAFTSSIANAVRRFGSELTSATLTNMAIAFSGQKLTHGGAIFGGLMRVMSKAEIGFDPDRLLSALQTKTADEWGSFAVGLRGGEMRVNALRAAILDAYEKQSLSE